jgi:hypothetical protein
VRDLSPGVDFPRTGARDLEGRDVTLPDALEGDRNVVIVAFRRHHQDLVDSWVPGRGQRAADESDALVRAA